jgi:hypothetical protein
MGEGFQELSEKKTRKDLYSTLTPKHSLWKKRNRIRADEHPIPIVLPYL